MAKRISHTSEVTAAVPEIIKEKYQNRYKWGLNDKLPNDLIRHISDSGTATMCVSKLTAFVNGKGFSDNAAAQLKVNPKQTANDLLADISSGLAIFEAVCLNVKYNVQGKPGSVYRMAVKSLRKKDNGNWIYNPRMGERNYTKADDIEYRAFNPNISPTERAKIIAEEIKTHGKQLGEILMDFQLKEVDNGDVYPVPDCYSGLEDIESDASLQRQDKRNIKKGFKAKVLIGVPGQIDDQQKDETGKTEEDYFKEDLKNFTGEEGSDVMVLQSKVKGETPNVNTISVADILNGIDGARNRITKAVCRHFGVPLVLLGIEVASVLGNNQAMVNSLKVMLAMVETRQARINRVFSMLFPGYTFEITKVNIFEFIPDAVMAQLTPDEKRALQGYAPVESGATDENKKILNTLSALNPSISSEIVKRMSNDELFKLIGYNGTTN